MERIEAGIPPLILGDGTQTMDFVYIDDIADANLRAATAAVTDVVCNVATGVETSLEELARLLVEAMGSDLEPEWSHLAPRRSPGASLGRMGRRLGS